MTENNQSEYPYYAFISYKREDEKWAKWLQKKLESYGFPIALRKENKDLPSKIRPIFRDQSELSGGNLKEEIEKGLAGSKYLIVICSPRSAQSPWVSKEVQYFIDNGRENNIIPFIIGGSPNAKNPEEECFPEGLRQLSGEKEILGININEMGRDAAAIKVIARMFGLRFDTLWQRHKRQEEKEKVLLKKRNEELFNLQARIVTSKCKEHIKRGDSYLAIKLIVAFLNKSKKIDKLPYIPAIEETLRLAMRQRNCIYTGHLDNVTGLAFSQVVNLLITGSNDNTLKLWNTVDGQQIATLEQKNGLSSTVEAISFDDSGELFVSSTSRSLRIWSVSTLQVLDYFEDTESDVYSRILNVRFYKDNIIYSINNQICLYNRKLHLRTVVYVLENMIEHLDIDDEYNCLFCKSNNHLYVFNIYHNNLRLIKDFHNCTNYNVNNHTHLLAVTMDTETSIWKYMIDEITRESIIFEKKDDFHKNGLFYLSKDSNTIYCYSDGTISVFRTDALNEKSIMTWKVGNNDSLYSQIRFDPDQELFYVSVSNEVKQIDVRILNPDYIRFDEPESFQQIIKSFAIGQDSKVFAISEEAESKPETIVDFFNVHNDGMVMRFDIHGRNLHYVRLEDVRPSDIELSYHNSYAFVNHFRGFRILDSDTLRPIFKINSDYELMACPGSINRNCLIGVTADDGLGIMETNFLTQTNLWSESYSCDLKHSGSGKLTLSPSRKLVCFSNNKVISVISLDTHNELFSLRSQCNIIMSVCFSRDSKKIAVTTDGDYALSVYDLKTSKKIVYRPLFKNSIFYACYSEDGKYLLITGERKIIVLSSDGYQKVDEMTGEFSHKGIVKAAFYDNIILSLDGNGYLRRWRFEPMSMLIDKANKQFGATNLRDEMLRDNYVI